MKAIRMDNSRKLDTLILIGVVAGFLLFILSLIFRPQTVFPADWFPSDQAAFAFEVVFSAWCLCEIVNSFWSRKNSGAASQDKGSVWIVTGAGFIVLLVAFAYPGGLGSLQYAGLALAVAGIALREWAILVLGEHFTVRIQIREKARLVTDGPYRYIRHPAYTGSLMTYVGLPLAVGSVPGVVMGFVVCIAAYEYRILVEEKALQDAFGPEYSEYKKRTWKLFPGF